MSTDNFVDMLALCDTLQCLGVDAVQANRYVASLIRDKYRPSFIEAYGRGNTVHRANNDLKDLNVLGDLAMDLRTAKASGEPLDVNTAAERKEERHMENTFSEINNLEELWYSKQVVNRSSVYIPTPLSNAVGQILVNNSTCFAEGKTYVPPKVCLTSSNSEDNEKLIESYLQSQPILEDKRGSESKLGAEEQGIESLHNEKFADDSALKSASTRAPHGYGVQDLVCGSTYTLALTTSGHVYQWGTINGKIYPVPNKVPIAFPLRVIQIASGRKHALALLEGGFVVSWGCGYFGQLGHGDDQSYDKPKMIHHLDPQRLDGGDRVVKVACGGMHSVVSTDGQAIYSFGFNRYGQCGTGNCSNKISTPRVASTTHLVDLEFNQVEKN